MPTINPTLPTLGDLNLTEDPDTRNALLTIVNAINGQLDKDNLLDGGVTADELRAAELAALGLNSTGIVRRGKAMIPTFEGRTNTAYGLLATPDRVAGVVVPADALVVVSYFAQWIDTVAGAGRAALFVGANQLKVQSSVGGANAPVVEAATVGPNDAVSFQPLFTVPWGLASNGGGGSWASDVNTGQALGQAGSVMFEVSGTVVQPGSQGGLCIIDNLAAGTYDFSVQFKATSGTVSAQNRRLRVWVLGF